MQSLDTIIERARKTTHGFTDLKIAAEEIVATRSVKDSLRLAQQLFASDLHQARMIATFVYGMRAAQSAEALQILRKRVSADADWRVQEILAQAFDRYCRDIGYEQVLPIITDWLADANPNTRRAVTEGLRIWTTRPYFKEHPQAAIRLLRQLKADKSEYVRKSVGNALRDISRKHKDLIRAELQTWNANDKAIAQTYKLASQFLTPQKASPGGQKKPSTKA